MYIDNYFNTTIWSEQKPEFVKSLNKASNKYIADARKRNKEHIKNKRRIRQNNKNKKTTNKTHKRTKHKKQSNRQISKNTKNKQIQTN